MRLFINLRKADGPMGGALKIEQAAPKAGTGMPEGHVAWTGGPDGPQTPEAKAVWKEYTTGEGKTWWSKPKGLQVPEKTSEATPAETDETVQEEIGRVTEPQTPQRSWPKLSRLNLTLQ